MKQMFDISEKLTTEQSDEIHGTRKTSWENSSWKYLSLVGDEEIISLLHTKVYVFSDSVLCLGKVNENPESNIAWEDRLTWFKSSPEYRALDRIDREPMEFEWNIFQGFTTLQHSSKVQEFNIGGVCIHGKELFRQFAFRQQYRERSHFKTVVRHI